MAGDRRLGLRSGALDEPMDTIFVKNVRPNSPASVAGLATGDRIVSVNGQTISSRSYAQVVQLIHQSPSFLHLLVVPKEDDILQLVSLIYSPNYFKYNNDNYTECIEYFSTKGGNDVLRDMLSKRIYVC